MLKFGHLPLPRINHEEIHKFQEITKNLFFG